MPFLRRFCHTASGFHFYGYHSNTSGYRERSPALHRTPNLEGQVSEFMCPSDWVTHTPGSLLVAFYISQDHGGGILTSLHAEYCFTPITYHTSNVKWTESMPVVLLRTSFPLCIVGTAYKECGSMVLTIQRHLLLRLKMCISWTPRPMIFATDQSLHSLSYLDRPPQLRTVVIIIKICLYPGVAWRDIRRMLNTSVSQPVPWRRL
jgi:hypothetical protein